VSEKAASKTAALLTIPVNEHSGEAPGVPAASEQFEYANPVTLKNRLILYANAVIEATDKLNDINDAIASAKSAKRHAENDLESYEGRLLRLFPPEKNLTTLKLVQAYLERVAHDRDDTADQYYMLREAVKKAEENVAKAQAKADKIKAWLSAIETASQNITTHLSYVKFDSKLR
jgi:chromosome segregation ATPase